MFTFTINPTPSDATVELTAPGYVQTGNSIDVPSGTIVTWKVSASGYTEQNGTHTVTKTETKSVTLNEDNGWVEMDYNDGLFTKTNGKYVNDAGAWIESTNYTSWSLKITNEEKAYWGCLENPAGYVGYMQIVTLDDTGKFVSRIRTSDNNIPTTIDDAISLTAGYTIVISIAKEESSIEAWLRKINIYKG